MLSFVRPKLHHVKGRVSEIKRCVLRCPFMKRTLVLFLVLLKIVTVAKNQDTVLLNNYNTLVKI